MPIAVTRTVSLRYDALAVDAPRAAEVPRERASDEALHRAFVEARDEAALGALVARHWERVFRLAWRVVRDPGAAEDAAQRTFVALASSRAYRGEGPLAAWIARVALNEARKALRSRRRRALREAEAAARAGRGAGPGGAGSAGAGPGGAGRGGDPGRAGGGSSGRDASESDLAVALDAHLERLPEDLRTPLLLRYAEGLTHEEVAGALGVASGTASSRIRRGLERLRGSLAAEGLAAAVPALEDLLARLPPPPPAPPPPSGTLVAHLAAAAAREALRGALALAGGLIATAGVVASLVLARAGTTPLEREVAAAAVASAPVGEGASVDGAPAAAGPLEAGGALGGAGAGARGGEGDPAAGPREGTALEGAGAPGGAAAATATAATTPAPVDGYAGICVAAEDARPVAGAEVLVLEIDYAKGARRPQRLVRETRTGEDGRFAFPDLARIDPEAWGWRHHVVLARAPGRGLGTCTVRSSGVDPGALVLRLGRPATLGGTVRDGAGAPVADARVWLRSVGMREYIAIVRAEHEGRAGAGGEDRGEHLFVSEPVAGLETRTDAEGTFAIEGLPAGMSAEVAVEHPRFQRAVGGAETPGPIEVTLEAGATVEGRVVLGPSGEPAAGVAVSAQSANDARAGVGASWARTHTDAQGRYRLEGLAGERYNIWAEAADWTVIALDSFAAKAGETLAAPDLRLVRGGAIEGRVVDAASGEGLKPGASADVGLYGPARPRSGAAIEVGEIGPDGRFWIRAAPGGNHVYLRAGRGFEPVGPAAHDVLVEEGRAVEVRFVVRRAGEAPAEGRGR